MPQDKPGAPQNPGAPKNPSAPQNRKPHPNARKDKSKSGAPSDLAHVRWIALSLSIALIAISLALRLQPSLIPKGSALASDMFGKVGIVLMCVWLAWPALEALWRAPSGIALVMAALVVLVLFIYRPRTIYVTGPFIAIAAGLAILLGWVRNLNK